MKQRLFLHIDMDAFFAAIEQRDNPELIGKPVIIAPDPNKGQLRGVVSTCSYEARKYGIHSAMPVSKAYQLCPNGIYIWGHMWKYSAESKEIMQIFEQYTSRIEKISIDEAFLEISDILHMFEDDPVKIAYQIQAQIKQERNLTCSIGISYKKFLSKIGSDFNKPNGITYILPEDEISFLNKLKIEKLWGVGVKTLPKFKKLNIHYVGDIRKYQYQEICTYFGKMGDHYWKLANAIDDRDLSKAHIRKSCSKEYTFEHDTDDFKLISNRLYRLCEEVISIMRNNQYQPKTIHIKLRFSDFRTLTRQTKFKEKHLDIDVVYNLCLQLYSKENSSMESVRLIGMGFDLSLNESTQMNLFDTENDRKQRLNKSLDEINHKFGKNMIKGAEGLK